LTPLKNKEGQMPPFTTENMIITDVRHLPIVKAYAQKIGLVETIDQMVDTQMEVSPGMVIFAMVLDTLSGRTPLYRLTEFFEDKDTALLLGADIEPERFCDYNLGRAMDRIYETGTQKIFSQIAQNALMVFTVDPRRIHFDTTSVDRHRSLWPRNATIPIDRLPGIRPMTVPLSFTEKPTGQSLCIPVLTTKDVINASTAC
jgi:hypothetical protein